MSDTSDSQKTQNEEVEAALLDAELFLKYDSPPRAIVRLRSAIESHPRSIQLREKLREIATVNKQSEEAARQCLALASLYLARENFEDAHDRLLEAKRLDPRINIASALAAIQHARHPELYAPRPSAAAAAIAGAPRRTTFAGDLSDVSIFDAVQVLENARLTGALNIYGEGEQQPQQRPSRVLFNEGRIVGAESGDATALEAFRMIVETTTGNFDFEKSAQEFPITINTPSNTNLLLDTLRQLDEENAEGEETVNDE